MSEHKFPYRWNLSDGYPAKGVEANGLKVFGTFICGGGSTMGYKLAGYNHLGGVEIDKKIADVYRVNHNPQYLYNEDIREFNERTDLPDELYNLDILDGSPPCSTFSMAGSRESAWGKDKVFREGQAKQVLDDLVFVYCETIKKLQPKVFILENVKGIIQGNAKAYSRKITEIMTDAGYSVQVFCLNAITMGVPQRRERVFFIGTLKSYNRSRLEMDFNENGIPFGEIQDDTYGRVKVLEGKGTKLWEKRIKSDTSFSDISLRLNGKSSGFSTQLIQKSTYFPTIVSSSHSYLYDDYTHINDRELTLVGSYPQDYNFLDQKVRYMVGMSVPPVMTAQIAHQIYLQWFQSEKTNP